MFKGLAKVTYLRKDIMVLDAPPLIRFSMEPQILKFKLIALVYRVSYFSPTFVFRVLIKRKNNFKFMRRIFKRG